MRLSIDPPTDAAAYDFHHPIRVRFAETDAMGVVHHASFLPYLEEARVAYLRHLDHPYTRIREEGIDFAVLEVFVQYRSPLRFDDVVNVHVAVGDISRVTCQIAYLLEIDGEAKATAVTVHGCVNERGRAVRVPEWIRTVAHDRSWSADP